MTTDFDKDHARLPGWVNRLRDRVDILELRTEYLMAQENDTQAQADQLGTLLTALTTDWNDKAAEIATLEDTIKTLQSQVGSSVDLSGLLAQATALRTSMETSETVAAATQAAAALPSGDQTAAAGADAGSGTTAAPIDQAAGTGTASADGSQTADATA